MLNALNFRYASKYAVISQGFIRRIHKKLSYRHKLGTVPFLPLTIGNLLQEVSEKYGDREALVSLHQNKKFTYREALKLSDKLAGALQDIGLKKGDRVGIWASNLWEWYITMFGCARAGVILVTINPAYQPPELEYCINKVGLKSIICQHKDKYKNYYELVKQLAPELPESEPGRLKSSRVPSLESVIVIGDRELKGAYNFQEVLDKADDNSTKRVKDSQDLTSPDEECSIQFTSGTTGYPQGALLSHFSMVNSSYQTGLRSELFKKQHRMCVLGPLFHVLGNVLYLCCSVNFGATVILPSSTFNPDAILHAIAKEKCTVVMGTPTMYVDLINTQRKNNEDVSLDLALAGGAPCPPNLLQQIKDVLNVKTVQSVYGLTEATAAVFYTLPTDSDEKVFSSVGILGDHLEAKVVDDQDNIVPCGTPGELCIRGYPTMHGYWKNDAKTKEVMGPDRWLRTGDLFILEEDGYAKVVGRKKDMIIRGGENVYSREVEDFLSSHPDILECQVIGIPHERLGEEVAACIRVKEGAKLSKEDIAKFCKGSLSYYKIPSKVRIVESFPKTGSGKIQKFKLQEEFAKYN